MRKWMLGIAALAAVVIGLLVSACAEVPQARTETERIELGAARTVRIEVNMGVGALLIGGGGQNLLDAQFTYSYDSWKPIIDYTVAGSNGALTITQPSDVGTVGFPNVRYEWDLRFNRDVPLEMKVNMGVGGGELDLGELNLRKLDLGVGVGGTELDLTGDWKADLQATISGGVGGLKLTLPNDVGVRVEAHSGLGTVDAQGFQRQGNVYTNDAYGHTDISLEIKLSVGVGGAQLVLTP
jgi:hypothetical protein